MEWIPLRKLKIDLVDVENDWIHLKRNTPVGNRIEMTISINKKGWYSHRNMRTPLRKGMESTLDIEATRIPQTKTKKDWLAK